MQILAQDLADLRDAAGCWVADGWACVKALDSLSGYGVFIEFPEQSPMIFWKEVGIP